MSAPTRRFGHVPDDLDLVSADLDSRNVSKLIGSPTSRREHVDHRALLGLIPDQGQTSSCVGQALATSCYMRAKLRSETIPRPSAFAIYSMARLLDDPGASLRDEGSRPSLALRAMSLYGLVPESRWPARIDNVDVMPPLDVFVHGQMARLVDYYRVPRSGAVAAIERALSKGFFPCFAMQVDEAFEQLDSFDVYGGLTGASLGGHYQCIVGDDAEAFIVAGSWGTSFGDGGFVRVAKAFVESADVTDILVPTIVPKVLS